MGRLIDEMHRRLPIAPDLWGAATCVDATEVASYVAAQPDDREFDLVEFPNCAPPWPIAWIEFAVPRVGWNRPEKLTAAEKVALEQLWRPRMGWLVNAVEVRRDGALAQAGIRWILIADLMVWPPLYPLTTSPLGHVIRHALPIAPDGHIPSIRVGEISETAMRHWLGIASIGMAGDEASYLRTIDTYLREAKMGGPSRLFLPAFGTPRAPVTMQSILDYMGSAALVLKFTLCFANCINVKIETVNVPERLRLARVARGRAPVTRWETLHIGGIREALRMAHDTEAGASIGRALHLCRGHFKRYTAEKPLFGNRTGTWFWHQQMRGNAALGRIVKEYAVAADEP